MSSPEYEKYIRSPKWKDKRKKILKRDKNSCVWCGAKKNLHVHHLTYDNIFNEKNSDLITLCRLCHKKIHNFEFLKPTSNKKKKRKNNKRNKKNKKSANVKPTERLRGLHCVKCNVYLVRVTETIRFEDLIFSNDYFECPKCGYATGKY